VGARPRFSHTGGYHGWPEPGATKTRACRWLPMARCFRSRAAGTHFSHVGCRSLTAWIRPGSYAGLATGLIANLGHFTSDIGMTTWSA
jgi:hypothetical protein